MGELESSFPFAGVDDDELSDGELALKYGAVRLGPSWSRRGDGSFRVPRLTLGWAVAQWAAKWLLPLADGQDAFTFTNEQFRLILWWYAVDEGGAFAYRSMVLQRIKGWGKDPFTAVLCLVEAFGPAKFGGWDERGLPRAVARKNAWVQVFALSKEQTTNTASMFPILMSDEFKKAFGIDAGVEIIRGLNGRVRIEVKTASWRSAEGGRPDFLILNETQHWLSSNSGAQLSRTARRNASKVKGRYVCITNMPVPGEGSVAEGDRENQLGVLEGRFEDRKVLFDSIEAPDHAPLTKRVFDVVYRQCRGDSVWCDPGDAWLEVLDTNNPEGESRRMFWNQYWLQEGSLYSPDEWASIGSSSSLSVGDRVCLGFDGGKTDDSTALVAVRVSDGLIVPLLLEEKPAGVDKWHVDVDRVNSAVHRAFRDYDVVGFWADVQFWETQIQQWSEDYGSRLLVQGAGGPIAWDMRQSRRVVGALHEAFMRAVLDGAVRHGVDPYGLGLERSFRRHVMNTVRVDSSGGVTFGKRGGRESALKVDMYAAAMLAFGAYQEVRLQSALRPPKAAGVMRVQRR